MNIATSTLLFWVGLLMSLHGWSQQQISIEVHPTVNRSIDGHLMLDRSKYFNLATSPEQYVRNNFDQARFDYYFGDLEMTFGRNFQLIASETRWGNGFREDPNRPGFMDTTYFKNQKNPHNNGMTDFMGILGANAGVASHDAHDAYPDFMPKYTLPNAGDDVYPANMDAAAEMVAYYFKYSFTDFLRPATFELINEPHWKYWSDPKFIEFHTKAKEKVDELGVDMEVGGPCLSVGYFYRNNYQNLTQLTDFMGSTHHALDFYSFHLYDYMRWDNQEWDFVGNISSGLPEEGVFDALAAYYHDQTGDEFKFVATEHGGYVTNTANRTQALDTIASTYFPGSGFQHEMKKRSVDNFVMVNSAIANTLTFMNHPHIIRKVVPFILLESANWDTRYYASLLVKENFDKNSNVWHEAPLINFYTYFADVRGRRVLSHTSDTDIQQFAFVDDNKLIVLLHNQSNEGGEIALNIDPISQNNMQEIMIRRVGRAVDFTPYFSEDTLPSLDTKISIGAQESIALFISYVQPISPTQSVNELIAYSKDYGVEFTGSKTFTVPNSVSNPEYAILRVGLSRPANLSKKVEIKLNGTLLSVPVEDCADRITGEAYKTTKIVKVDASLLQASNSVEVKFPDGGSGGVGAVVLRVGVLDPNVGIKDKAAIHEPLLIFPNPAQTEIRIHTTPHDHLEILDLNGKVMTQLTARGGLSAISIEELAPAMYILRVTNQEGVRTARFQVER